MSALPVAGGMDDPREFRYIEVRYLIIDRRKQRDLDAEKAARIANEWDWNRVEAITVAKAQVAGCFDVIEGQHRVSAGQSIDPTLKLPCLILPDAQTDAVQSQVALDILTGRRGHSAYDQWRLRLNSGHPHEIAANDVLEGLGLRLGKSPSSTSIGAVATVRRIVHGGNFTPEMGATLLEKTIKVLLQAFPTYDHESNVTRWDRWLLLAVSKIIFRYEDYDESRLAQSLRQRPAIQWINVGKGFGDLTPDEAIIEAVKPVYNKGRRKGRFE